MQPKQEGPAIYWAGDRGFFGSTRWHDLETVAILRKNTAWTIHHPFEAVQASAKERPDEPFLGSKGKVRRVCLDLLKSSTIVVAYVGGYDTGTAQELEAAKSLSIPILAWSDAALFRGESAEGGRRVAVGQSDLAKLAFPAIPMNAMTTHFDLYIEDSRLKTRGLSPGDLAEMLRQGVEQLLEMRRATTTRSG